METPDILWIVEDLLHAGATLLCGKPKGGKSYFALQLALDIILERKALGRFNVQRPGRVLYFALEDTPRRIRDRLRQLLPSATPEQCELLHSLNIQFKLPVLTNGGAAELDSYLGQYKYAVVIIDTLVNVLASRGKTSDLYRADYAETKLIRELAQKHDVAFLCTLHTRKALSDDPLDLINGTNGTAAGAVVS